jgi:hypothetical protein
VEARNPNAGQWLDGLLDRAFSGGVSSTPNLFFPRLSLPIRDSAMAKSASSLFVSFAGRTSPCRGKEVNQHGYCNTPSERKSGQSAQTIPEESHPFGHSQHGPKKTLVRLQKRIAPHSEKEIHPQA